MSTAGVQVPRVPRLPLVTRAALVAGAQTLVGVAAWAAFGLGWGRVVTQGLVPSALLDDGALLVGVFLVVAVVTTWWIRHNQAIYHRKGPRVAPPAGPGYPLCDRLGRAVVADVASVRDAADVLVVVDDAAKTFVQR